MDDLDLPANRADDSRKKSKSTEKSLHNNADIPLVEGSSIDQEAGGQNSAQTDTELSEEIWNAVFGSGAGAS
jgi:hypothetical protein